MTIRSVGRLSAGFYAGGKYFWSKNVTGMSEGPAVPHRKDHDAKISPRGPKAPIAKKSRRALHRAARGALLAASFTAMQFFNDEAGEPRRLFDSRVVDSLQAPLTHYHE